MDSNASSSGSHSEPRKSSEQVDKKKPKSLYLMAGGCLTLVTGVLALINGLKGVIGDSPIVFGADTGSTRYFVCGIIIVLFGILAIAGGISAIRGKHFTLALAGGVLGMIGDGAIGFFLGLAALALFALSNEDISG